MEWQSQLSRLLNLTILWTIQNWIQAHLAVAYIFKTASKSTLTIIFELQFEFRSNIHITVEQNQYHKRSLEEKNK